jgi:peptidoglycan/LPS O-acetylase OafA/YrhL
MTRRATNIARGLALVALGLALAAAGIYVGETDDAPGAALIGLVLMVTLVVLGLRTARRRA